MPRGRRHQHQQGGRVFKSQFGKIIKFTKKVGKNKTFRNVTGAAIKEEPDAIESLSKKLKNKRLKSILNNNITKMGVDLATGFTLDKLK